MANYYVVYDDQTLPTDGNQVTLTGDVILRRDESGVPDAIALGAGDHMILRADAPLELTVPALTAGTIVQTDPTIGDTLTRTGSNASPSATFNWQIGGVDFDPAVTTENIDTTGRAAGSYTGGVADGVQPMVYTPAVTVGAAATAPAAFVDANWSVATGATLGGQLDVSIATLPAANGATITDIEYDLDASGTWVSSEGTVGFTITGQTAATSLAVRLRAVNAAGNGLPGNSESATSSAAAAASWSSLLNDSFGTADGYLLNDDIATESADWEAFAIAGTISAVVDPLGIAKITSTGADADKNIRISYTGTVDDDQAVEVVVDEILQAVRSDLVLFVRGAGSELDGTMVRAFLERGNSQLLMNELTAGVTTQTRTATLAPLVANDVVRLQIIGSTAILSVNGTTIDTLSGVALTGGKPGFGAYMRRAPSGQDLNDRITLNSAKIEENV